MSNDKDAKPQQTDEQIEARVEAIVITVTKRWNRPGEDFLEIGRLLNLAKKDLPRGTFMKMTKERLPFTHNTATRFMQIQRRKVLCAHAHNWPRSWATVHALLGFSDELLEKYFADGTINCETERPQVEEMLRALKDENENKDENKDEDENKDYDDGGPDVKPGKPGKRKKKKHHDGEENRDAVIVRNCQALIGCMNKYPQVDTLDPKYFADQKIAKSELKRLADWVGELADVAPEWKQATILVKGIKKQKRPVTEAQSAALERGRTYREQRPAT